MLPPLPCFTQNAFRVDPSTIDVLIEEGTFVLGAEWTSQQLGIDASSRSVEPLPSKSRSNKKLYRPSHEMIGALVEYRMWRSTADYEQIEAPQAVHNLAYLFSMLRNVRGCAGLEHVLHKLRSPREYLGAWFEIFIASQLQKHGSQVRFNPPSHDQHVRSPDLHVTSSEGIEYWAECKYLIGLSDQAVVEKKFMSELVERVHRHWKRVNLNARLTIRVVGECESKCLDKVSAAVLAMSSQLSEQQKHITGAAVGGQYLFALERLCEPGDSLPSYVVQAMARESGGDCAIFESSGGRPGHMLDPKIIAFVLPQEKDDSQYKRLLRGFNDARDQLTKDGPGAVFLGVSPPQNLARSNILGNFAAALKRQLQGTENTRVNFAYVITFEIVRTVAGVMEEIAAGQFVHVNPKHVI